MAVQLSDDEITNRVKAWQRRARTPIVYSLIFVFPLAADFFRVPVAHVVLLAVTVAIYAAAIAVRRIVARRKPDPAADVDPLMFRQRLVELGDAARRSVIVASSLALAILLWAAPYAASPMKSIEFAALVGVVFGLGTAKFLLNIRILPVPKVPAFRDQELTAMIRNQAAKWSGLILMTMAVVALPATMLRPETSRTLLSVMVWTACEAPLLIFAWLEYGIERNV